jgi:hypothetical protein
MPISFWIFLVVCVISFIPVFKDHGEAWKLIKESNGKERCKKCLHLFALWFIPVFSLIGTLFLGFESISSDKKDARRDNQYRYVTNQLHYVATEYIEATNALQNLKNSQPRSLTLAQQMFLGRSVDWMTNKPAIKINVTIDADDGEILANQFDKVFTEAGFKVDSVALGLISGLPSNHGIFVIGQTNEITTALTLALNQCGLLATNSKIVISTNEIFIDIEAK